MRVFCYHRDLNQCYDMKITTRLIDSVNVCVCVCVFAAEEHARQMQMREQELRQEIKVEKQRADQARQELQAAELLTGVTEKTLTELKVRPAFIYLSQL